MRFSVRVLAALSAVILAGCGGAVKTTPIASVTPIMPTLVSGIMPFDQVVALQRGATHFLMANRIGFKVEAEPVTLQSAFRTGEDAKAVYRGTKDVGYGFSGTPTVDKDGKLVGPLYSGNDGDSFGFYTNSGEDMAKALLASASAGGRAIAQGRKSTWLVSGASQSDLDKWSGKLSSYDIRLKAPTGNGRQAEMVAPAPQAGSTICVQVLSGPVAQIEAFGTLTMQGDGGRWMAFGHPLDQKGSRSLPVTAAYVDQVVNTGSFGTFKDCHSVGPIIGALVNDTYKGVVIDIMPAAVPTTTPVVLTLTVDGGPTKSWTHRAARDQGSSMEQYAIMTGLMTPLRRLNDESGQYQASGMLTLQVEGGNETGTGIVLPEPIVPAYYGIGRGRGGVDPSINIPTSVNNAVNQVYSKVYDLLSQSSVPGKAFTKVVLDLKIEKYVAPARR